MKKKIIGIFLVLVLVLSACAGQGINAKRKSTNDKEEKKVKVLASFYPIADLSKKIGGDHVEVKNLIKNGSAHGYEPSVGDMKDITEADIVIVNGAGFESWLEKVRENNPELNIVDLSKDIDLIAKDQMEDDHNHHEDKDHEEDHDHHDENDHEEDHDEKEHEGDHGHEGHKHGPNDPHLWLSLTNLEKMAKSIYENLAKIDSKNELSYKENYHLLQEKFEGLEVKFKEAFSKHQGKAIIVPHEAFAYLSQEFGFEQIGLEGINSDSEPTLTKIAEISKIMKEKNITTVFYDLGKSDKAAQTIAKETGANVKAISTLEVLSDEDQKEARDLLSLMEMNLQNILDSFEGK